MNLTCSLGDTKFLFSCWKKIFLSLSALTREIFFNKSKRNFISPRGHVISSLSLYMYIHKTNNFKNIQHLHFKIISQFLSHKLIRNLSMSLRFKKLIFFSYTAHWEPQSSRRNLVVLGNLKHTCYWRERTLLQYLSIVSKVRVQLNDSFERL